MKINSSISKNSGFTFIEVIVSLLLLGLLSVFAGMGISMAIKGYSITRKNAEVTNKGQLATTRLIKELKHINSVPSGTSTTLNYTSYKQDILNSHTVSWAGDVLLLDGDPLTDDVAGFDIGYYDTYNGIKQVSWSVNSRIIEITLSLVGANNNIINFMIRVVPRNI
ncbi:type II secretion system protein [Thermodesulfobacteriota bacterium]